MEFLICLGIALIIDLVFALSVLMYAILSDWEYSKQIVITIIVILTTTALVWVVREGIRNNPQIQQNEEQRIEDMVDDDSK